MFSEKIDSQSNVRSIREAESQTRALQVFIAESYFMGDEKLTYMTMWRQAYEMASVPRMWYPKDLISTKAIICTNTDSLDLSNLPLHTSTLKNLRLTNSWQKSCSNA